MSILKYNNITLPYGYTTRFDQSPIYDDVGQTDWCGTRFDIQIQTILNANYMNIIAPQYSSNVTANAAAVMQLIRTDLMKPRKTLSFTFNDVEIIPAAAGVSGTVDTRNGPKPRSCQINQLTNETFLCVYRIEAIYWENYATTSQNKDTDNNLRGNNVLFNRWTETIDIDRCDFSTRIREGKYMIRSDNFDGVTADEVRRQMAVVGTIPGFLRESSSYTVSPDGLAIKYRVIDKEVFKVPPKPAFRAEGEYVESTTNLGAIRWGEVRVRLEGSKDTPQHELVRVAVAVGTAKLNLNGAAISPSPGSRQITNLAYSTLEVGMYSNYVEYKAKARLTIRKERLEGQDAFVGAVVATPGSDVNAGRFGITANSSSPPYQDRGTASLLLQAASYYDPSITTTQLGPGPRFFWTAEDESLTSDTANQLSRGQEVGTAGVRRET